MCKTAKCWLGVFENLRHSLLMTCTVTELMFPTEAWQAYRPESPSLACWIRRKEAVTFPFSVI